MADEEKERKAAENLKTSYGCCCSCCGIRAEMWFFFVYECVNVSAQLTETSTAFNDHFKYLLLWLMFGVSLPSACMFLYALKATGGQPRRYLARWITIKIPIFILNYFLFFGWPAPDVPGLEEWGCNPSATPHAPSANATLALFAGNMHSCKLFMRLDPMEKCLFPVIFYSFSFKAAKQYMRCHPDNDDLGVWSKEPGATYRPMIEDTAYGVLDGKA